MGVPPRAGVAGWGGAEVVPVEGGRWRAARDALFVSAGGRAGRASPTPEGVQTPTSPPGGPPDGGGAPRRGPAGRAAHRPSAPKGDPSADYRDSYEVLVSRHGFEWKQGRLYTLNDDDMAKLFAAVMDLKAMSWFPKSVRDIRAFRVEQWSDFTPIVKGRV